MPAKASRRPPRASRARRPPEPGTPAYQQLLADLWRRGQERDARCPIRRAAFAQLSAALGIAPPALAALGLAATATEADVRRAYRGLVLQHHTDRGGSVEAFRVLTERYREALRVVGALRRPLIA
jgi:hypothetical protein